MKRGVAIAVGLVALGLLVWFGRSMLFEKVRMEVPKEYSGEAATNPFFALRELYRGMGLEAETSNGLRSLPPHDHTLLLALRTRPLLDKDVTRLWQWVEEGGHLVLAADSPLAPAFFERLGIGAFLETEADEDDHESRSSFDTARRPWPKLYVGEESPLLRSDGARDAAWVLTVAEGEGALTVVVDFAPLTNTELSQKEHAELAWWLVRSAEDQPPAGVWIVHRDPPTSVWALLASRARPLVLALSLLCAAGLALLARPFGPRLAPPPKDRRHLSEHLSATGHYLWQRQVEHVLLAAVQQSLRDRLAQGGAFSPRQIRELVARLASSAPTGTPTVAGEPAGTDPFETPDAKQVREALELPSTRDRQQFTRTIRVLEQLRRSA